MMVVDASSAGLSAGSPLGSGAMRLLADASEARGHGLARASDPRDSPRPFSASENAKKARRCALARSRWVSNQLEMT
jgi:hypothetical protein